MMEIYDEDLASYYDYRDDLDNDDQIDLMLDRGQDADYINRGNHGGIYW
jgi:hypothetical protein